MAGSTVNPSIVDQIASECLLGHWRKVNRVWFEAKEINLLALRYALGAGLRIGTPIGPIALDYGINMNRRRQDPQGNAWEDFGAFHFSIGLF